MARVFFALRPDPSSLSQLHRLQQTLPQSEAWRPVAPSSMHLTLAFLGERADDDIRVLLQAVTAITLPPMLHRSGGWLWLPTADRPRVLAVAVLADPALESLAETLWQALDAAGWARPERRWLPHVTLARIGGRLACPSLQPPATATLGWDSLGLFESRLTPQGPCYRPLWSVTAAASAAP